MPLICVLVACRFGALGGWSSSLLRSMTSGADLLWLPEEGLADEVEGSRDEVGGVLIIGLPLPNIDWLLTAAILGISLISMRSSSSLSLAWPPPRRDGSSSSEVFLHTPSGSIVT